jgi:F420H(2)-dependent quinone reductase
VVIPSKGGLPEDPHWYRNALAEPTVGFESRPYRAEPVAEEAELRRLWALARQPLSDLRRVPAPRRPQRPHDPDPAAAPGLSVGTFLGRHK